MYKRCERDHGRGKCEKWGLIVYPKCRAGFRPFGCCICRPPIPNCHALGMNGGIGLSCAKKLIIGRPHAPGCPSDRDNNAGLCYSRCKAGYHGVGPVCWSIPPEDWVDCGMGSARDSETCKKIISGQIVSVGEMAVNIAAIPLTLGKSVGVNLALKAVNNSVKLP